MQYGVKDKYAFAFGENIRDR